MPGIRQVVKGAAALGGAGVAGFYLGAQGTQVAKSHCQVRTSVGQGVRRVLHCSAFGHLLIHPAHYFAAVFLG